MRTTHSKAPHAHPRTIHALHPIWVTLALTAATTLVSYYIWTRVQILELTEPGTTYPWYTQLFYFPVRIGGFLPYAEWTAPFLFWFLIFSLLLLAEKLVNRRA